MFHLIWRLSEAGADNLTLCDTNGGCLPEDIAVGVREARRHLPGVSFGIHVHNDSNCAVANSLMAVREGVDLVQGTLNGYGERCGNADQRDPSHRAFLARSDRRKI